MVMKGERGTPITLWQQSFKG